MKENNKYIKLNNISNKLILILNQLINNFINFFNLIIPNLKEIQKDFYINN